jgi:hypothetical protein
VHTVGDALLDVAEKDPSAASKSMGSFINQVVRQKGSLPPDLTRDLLDSAALAQMNLTGDETPRPLRSDG